MTSIIKITDSHTNIWVTFKKCCHVAICSGAFFVSTAGQWDNQSTLRVDTDRLAEWCCNNLSNKSWQWWQCGESPGKANMKEKKASSRPTMFAINKRLQVLLSMKWLMILFSLYFEDNNECNENNGGCSDGCVDTPGSYYCTCPKSGYTMLTDNSTCQGKFVMVCNFH